MRSNWCEQTRRNCCDVLLQFRPLPEMIGFLTNRPREVFMPATTLQKMDVNALLSLRSDIEKNSIKSAASSNNSFQDWAMEARVAPQEFELEPVQ